MKYGNYVLFMILVSAMLLVGCKSQSSAEIKGSTKASTAVSMLSESEAEQDTYQIEINIKDYGCIKAELDAVSAPITVANFIKLAKEGFYDGLTFHRIMDGFMVQGGDPLGTGRGGSGETIKGEFSGNGVDNPISHTRGTISMARSQVKDSATSQFFIVHQDSVFLDGDYAAFGQVTDGMDIVDKICKDVKAEDNNGTVKADNQPVIESIKVVE